MSRKKNEAPEIMKFEEGLERLGDIISRMEEGDEGLDSSIKLFQEGARLYRELEKKLKEARGEVKVILENFEGDLEKQDLDN